MPHTVALLLELLLDQIQLSPIIDSTSIHQHFISISFVPNPFQNYSHLAFVLLSEQE